LSTASTSSPVIDASYDKGAQIEDAAHIQALVEQKHAAHQHRGADRLSHVAPASKTLLIRAAERGSNLGSITGALLRLLDCYGAAELQAAIIEALDRYVPHPSAVRLALERQRHECQQLPPVAANLPEHVQARDVAVRRPRLELYDHSRGRPMNNLDALHGEVAPQAGRANRSKSNSCADRTPSFEPGST
jgi:hypothetical protein